MKSLPVPCPTFAPSIEDRLQSLLNNKHILVLGAGVMQLPIIWLAKRYGVQVTLVDVNESAIAVGEADRFLHIDLKNYQAIARQARVLSCQHPLHGVCTIGTDFSPSVAFVAEQLALPGIPIASAAAARFKDRMRTAISRYGLPTPRFTAYAQQDADIPGWDFFPSVVKPVDSMGARGVSIVRNRHELSAACHTALQDSCSGQVIIEEFIPGPEYSVDAVWIHGKLYPFGVAVRHIYFDPYRIELGHTFPAPVSPERYAALMKAVEQASRAVGITWGAVKADVFWDGSRAVIGEIAARLSGGFMSGWTYPLHSGVSAVLPLLLLTVGCTIPSDMITALTQPQCSRNVAERAIIGFPGVVQSIEGAAAAANRQEIELVWTGISGGSKVPRLKDNVSKCGNVIAVSSNGPERVAAAARTAIESIHIAMEPGESEAIAFLTASQPAAPLWFQIDQRTHYAVEEYLYRLFSEPVCISPLSVECAESQTDWLGRTIVDHINICIEHDLLQWGSDEQIETAAETAVLRALSRAGYAGVIYLFETFRPTS